MIMYLRQVSMSQGSIMFSSPSLGSDLVLPLFFYLLVQPLMNMLFSVNIKLCYFACLHLGSPATVVKVGALRLSPVFMPMSPQQRTSVVFSSPQLEAASTSAVVAPASTTMASRKRRRPHHHRGLQQREVSDYFLLFMFSLWRPCKRILILLVF